MRKPVDEAWKGENKHATYLLDFDEVGARMLLDGADWRA